jgi:hypothetical protein
MNKDKPIKSKEGKTKSAYLNIMESLKNQNDIPDDVKSEIDRLVKEVNIEKPTSITFNISSKDNSTFNAVGTSGLIQKQEQHSPPQPQQDESDEYDSDGIPSDISIDHHLRHINEYTLSFQRGTTELEGDFEDDGSKWILGENCIFDLCAMLKKLTIQMTNQRNSAQLPDTRLYVLNDIYLFDRNFELSVSKYFTHTTHNIIKTSISFETHFPARGIRCL